MKKLFGLCLSLVITITILSAAEHLLPVMTLPASSSKAASLEMLL